MKHHSDSHRKISKTLILSLTTLFFAICTLVLFIHGGYFQKIIDKFSPNKPAEFHATYNDKAIDAWGNSLSQLHPDADIVFFGDSLTRRGNFDVLFPDKTICNLGLGSDTITGMTERIGMIASVSPDKVFIMGGINSLRNDTLEQSTKEYSAMLDKVSEYGFPEVYIISVLPISKSKSDSLPCSPNTINAFNDSIHSLADKNGFHYIDIHHLLASSDGFIDSRYTTDGVHLTDDAYTILSEALSDFVN